jgi:hypothetical protein
LPPRSENGFSTPRTRYRELDIETVELAVGPQGRGRRYGIVHASWSEHDDIGADEIAVLATLSTYADRAGWCGVGQTTLGDRLKRSRSWTNKVLQRLDQAGVIKIQQLRDRGRIVGCRYLILGHAGICKDQAAGAGFPDLNPGDPAGEVAVTSAGDQAASYVADRVAGRHTDSPQTHRDSLSLRVNAAGEGGGFGESVGETTSIHALTPVDWQPSADDLAYASAQRPDLDGRLAVITQKFIHATRSRGQRFADVSAAWRCWVLRERTSPDHDSQPGTSSHVHNRADRAERPPASGIAARNRDTARDCLERVLARRGGRQSA